MSSTRNLEHNFLTNTYSSKIYFNCIWGLCLDYAQAHDKPLPSPLLGVKDKKGFYLACCHFSLEQ